VWLGRYVSFFCDTCRSTIQVEKFSYPEDRNTVFPSNGRILMLKTARNQTSRSGFLDIKDTNLRVLDGSTTPLINQMTG
jgi:hypothetical protein